MPAKAPAGNLREAFPAKDTVELSFRRTMPSWLIGTAVAEHVVPMLRRLQIQMAVVEWHSPLPLQVDALSQKTAHLLLVFRV